MDSLMLRNPFALRPAIRIDRQLQRLNDSISAIMLHFGIPTLSERAAAEAEALAEMVSVAANPRILDIPSQTDEALAELRSRMKSGDYVSEEEVIAAARMLQDEEDEERAPSAW